VNSGRSVDMCSIQPASSRLVKAKAVPLPPMVRRSFRFGLRLGLLFGVAVAVVKTVQSRRSPSPDASPPPAPWEPISEKPPARAPVAAEAPPAEVLDEVGEPIMEFSEPEPEPEPEPSTPATKAPAIKKAAKKATPAKKAAKKAAKLPAWVVAEGSVCPPTHPVKAKLASRLFHLPGMFAYDRTKPDRCYLDASTAVEDGFTSAKR